MEKRVGYNKIRDGQGASMHQICPDCIGLVLNKCLYNNKIVLVCMGKVCMHLLQHDHSSFGVSLVAFGRQMQI